MNTLCDEIIINIYEYIQYPDPMDLFLSRNNFIGNNLSFVITTRKYKKLLYPIYSLVCYNDEQEDMILTKGECKSTFMLTDKDLEGVPFEVCKNIHSGGRSHFYDISMIRDVAFEKHKMIYKYYEKIFLEIQEKKEEKREKRKLIEIEKREKRELEITNAFVEEGFENRLEESHNAKNYIYHNLGTISKIIEKERRRANLLEALTEQSLEHRLNTSLCYYYIEYDIKTIPEIIQIETRRMELNSALLEKGIELRHEPDMYKYYIEYGIGNVANIVETIVELKFYFKYTDYRNIMRRLMNSFHKEKMCCPSQSDREKIIEQAKEIALNRWSLRKTIEKIRLCSYLPISLRNKILA